MTSDEVKPNKGSGGEYNEDAPLSQTLTQPVISDPVPKKDEKEKKLKRSRKKGISE